jgi:PAS domain S-box-containing protein/diguanylate cyclase (GGDEF)-like protein
MAGWLFFTNHMHVLTAIAERSDSRLRDIARDVGITERATHRIVSELVEYGYLSRTRVGSRNQYEVHPDVALRHPRHARYKSGQVIRLLTDRDEHTELDAGPGLEQKQLSALPSHEIFRAAFSAAPTGMVLADASGRCIAVNSAYCAILGYRHDELIGRSFREFTHPDDIAADDEGLSELVAGERAEYVREKRYVRRDGRLTWVKLRVAATTDADTGANVFVAHVVDISERKRQERALAEAEERFRSSFDNAPIGMALVATDGRFLKVNAALCELTGYRETALLVRSFQSITHPCDVDSDLPYVEDVLAGRRRSYQLEKRYYHAAGHVIWVMLSVSLVRDASEQPLYFISQVEDITERKQREQALQDQAEQLAVQAMTDPLTGFGNRRGWDLAMVERIDSAAEGDEAFGVTLVALDGLKEINDNYGHEAGNDAIQALASTLRKVLRDGEFVARFSGAEFAILVPVADTDKMLTLAERILEALPEAQSASAGIATWDGGETAAGLLERSHQALSAARRSSMSQVRLAEASLPVRHA